MAGSGKGRPQRKGKNLAVLPLVSWFPEATPAPSSPIPKDMGAGSRAGEVLGKGSSWAKHQWLHLLPRIFRLRASLPIQAALKEAPHLAGS